MFLHEWLLVYYKLSSKGQSHNLQLGPEVLRFYDFVFIHHHNGFVIKQ